MCRDKRVTVVLNNNGVEYDDDSVKTFFDYILGIGYYVVAQRGQNTRLGEEVVLPYKIQDATMEQVDKFIDDFDNFDVQYVEDD